jgi:hypothetical protein
MIFWPKSRAIRCFAALAANEAALKQPVRDPTPMPDCDGLRRGVSATLEEPIAAL